jgi:methylated-DNA-[protein]-cysteine S-methyltransferase
MASVPTRVYDVVESPIGALLLLGDGESLSGLLMEPHAVRPEWRRSVEAFRDARVQLAEYFAGERRTFQLPLKLHGTPFQRRAWRALCEIPYGATRTYAQQARSIGQPTATRAIGAANGRNPIAIVVPCHRVVGHDGSLVGFGGGLERKRYLLAHEAARI